MTVKKAPNFKLLSTSNKIVELNKIKSKYIVLYFYPKDDTPGCTKESIGFTDQLAVFDSKNTLVLIITDNDGNDVSINWQRIKKVGEIILLGDSTTGGITGQQGSRCPSCNFDNKLDSKFCESCGTKI